MNRFSGFTAIYDTHRPRAPKEIADAVLSMTGKANIETVVDLGSGTGLSTQMWLGYAKKIIGIEPNDEMRNEAIKSKHKSIEYHNGSCYKTGLQEGSADIVSCGQSFHWMGPQKTLEEVSRIIKPGGIFVVIDSDWPPSVEWRVERAYNDLFTSVKNLAHRYSHDLPNEPQWPKDHHLKNMISSGAFTYCKEMLFHNCEQCDANRFVNIALSQGSIQTLLKNEIAEINPELTKFQNTVTESFGDSEKTMWVSYRVRIGIK